MRLDVVIAIAVAAGVVAGFIAIALSCRAPKRTHWHDDRNDEPVAKNLPSFEVFSVKEKHSRKLEAANAKE